MGQPENIYDFPVTLRSVPDLKPEQLAARQQKPPSVVLRFLLALHKAGNTADSIRARSMLHHATGEELPSFRRLRRLGEQGLLTIVLAGRGESGLNSRPIHRVSLTARGLEWLQAEVGHVCDENCQPITE